MECGVGRWGESVREADSDLWGEKGSSLVPAELGRETGVKWGQESGLAVLSTSISPSFSCLTSAESRKE